MNTFLLTMQYNESLCLPVFLRHYARYFSRDRIFIIDHGSTTDLTPAGCNRIRVPRERPFSELARTRAIRAIAAGLLEYFDAGVYVDCDELINLDGLGAFAAVESPVSYVAGFDVFAGETSNGRRLLGYLSPHLCKASVFRRTPDWVPGFHGCEYAPGMLAMPMAHIRFLFQERSAQRLRERIPVRQSMDATEASQGVAAQWGDGDHEYGLFYRFMEALGRRQARILRFSPLDASAMFRLVPEPSLAGPDRLLYRPTGYNPAPESLFDLTDSFPGLLDEVAASAARP